MSTFLIYDDIARWRRTDKHCLSAEEKMIAGLRKIARTTEGKHCLLAVVLNAHPEHRGQGAKELQALGHALEKSVKSMAELREFYYANLKSPGKTKFTDEQKRAFKKFIGSSFGSLFSSVPRISWRGRRLRRMVNEGLSFSTKLCRAATR